MPHILYIHHAAVNSQNVTVFRRWLAAYEVEHPGVIMRHAVGFLGHNYLIHATENIVEEVRKLGIPCDVHTLFRD
jgi:hypothetical protein